MCGLALQLKKLDWASTRDDLPALELNFYCKFASSEKISLEQQDSRRQIAVGVLGSSIKFGMFAHSKFDEYHTTSELYLISGMIKELALYFQKRKK